MQRSLIIGTATVAALFLAACGHDHHDDGNCCFSPIPPNYGPASLLSLSDAERELGNIATTLSLVDISSGTPSGFVAAARPEARALGPSHAAVGTFSGSQAGNAGASPRAAVSTCASGGSDQVSSGSKTRTFNYFSFSGTVNYTVDNYNGCANTDSSGTKTTYDGLIETGLDTSSVYSYAVLGQPSINNTVTIFTDSSSLHTEEDKLGIVEQQNNNATLDTRANLFDTLFASQPNQPDYDGSFQIGSSGNGTGVYEVMSSSTSLNVAGQYAYASTACYGGAVTVTTPTTLTLDSSTGLPVGGVLGIGSGSNSVTYTFNSDGSATLSGSVSGSISASQVQNILQTGTIC